MAVFTPVAHETLRTWLKHYDIGTLKSLEGITAGTENSNFFLTTSRGRYVLTLFERLSTQELSFHLHFMQHLSHQDIPCPQPLKTHSGQLWAFLENRPAAIVTLLPGQSVTSPSTAQCAALGKMLTTLHQAAQTFPARPHPRGLDWCQRTAKEVTPFLNEKQKNLLAQALEQQVQFEPLRQDLPKSAVHADLFRDNVLFDESFPNKIQGIIDFYFSGEAPWIFDLAVILNDWCVEQTTGYYVQPRLESFVKAYHAHRPLQPAEISAFPVMLQAAALRFWLSRLHDKNIPRPATLSHPKDPAYFERILMTLHLFPSPSKNPLEKLFSSM